MIYSALHNKNTNEDPKTSVVFENLMLLPDNVFWEILKNAAANKGILPEDVGLMYDDFYFWPQWDPIFRYDTGNSNYVEPDVFFRFEKIDVIVEAKYSDCVGQYREEWEREFKAYLNEYEDDKKKVVLLAVGGNPTFKQETEIKVGRHKCPIVKYSWVSLLNTVLTFAKEKLPDIEIEKQSSIKRIIKNVESGFLNIGVHKNYKKVELNGLRNLYTLGLVMYEAIVHHDTDYYTLSYCREEMNTIHYGYQFKVTPNDGRKKAITLTIALWINDQESICIGAKNEDGRARKLCKLIEQGKKFSSNYAGKPYQDGNDYYFDASKRFYKDFFEADTFDAQVNIVSKLIKDVCLYYLK